MQYMCHDLTTRTKNELRMFAVDKLLGRIEGQLRPPAVGGNLHVMFHHHLGLQRSDVINVIDT
jgi:hypothetical protein